MFVLKEILKIYASECVCLITWIQAIDLHIKNDYDDVI